jgi:penicillin amidase
MQTPMPRAIAASSISADLDRSTYIQTTGQSGNVFSGHYNDFAGLWADVQSIQIPAGDVADPVGVWSLSPG